jgi:hypothetical protein
MHTFHIQTRRLRTHCWAQGPEDGEQELLDEVLLTAGAGRDAGLLALHGRHGRLSWSA